MRPEQIVAVLVERLGGDVTITEHELNQAPKLAAMQDPTQFAWVLAASAPPLMFVN